MGRFDVLVSGARMQDVVHFMAAMAGTAGRAADAEAPRKGAVFRELDLPGGERLRLHYGLHGGERRPLPMACSGIADGGVVLVDLSMPSPQAHLARCLDALHRQRPGLPAAVGLTGLHTASPAQYRTGERWARRLAPAMPVLPLQPCNPSHVRALLELLASQMCPPPYADAVIRSSRSASGRAGRRCSV